MGLGKYLKAAFTNHWNLLAVGAGVVFSFLTGRPDIALPLVAAGEVAYLGMLGTHPKFQRYVEAQEAKRQRTSSESSAEQALGRITRELPKKFIDRYQALRSQCLELRGIARDMRDHGRGEHPLPLEDLQLAGLDRLLWIYLRLLHTEWSLERFLKRTSERQIQSEIDRLEQRLARYKAEPAERSPRREKATMAIEDNLETCRARLRNLEKAKDNHELVQLEIDRLENKIRSLSELAVNRQEPEYISGQVDAVASSMLDTERTMNELQFATGFAPVDESVPSLLNRAVEAEG